MKIGILGYGEIGQAIHGVYKQSKLDLQVFVKDLKFNNELNEIDFLNICIPQINDFESVVIKNAIESNAKNVIIHSTVKVGTTEKISKFLDMI